MSPADTSLNKSFRLLLLKSERLSIAKSAQSSKKCFTVKGVLHPNSKVGPHG